jgi:hypothetical protein
MENPHLIWRLRGDEANSDISPSHRVDSPDPEKVEKEKK